MRVLLVVGQFPEPSQRFIVSHFTGLLAHGVDAHVWCSVSDAEAWRSFPGLAEVAADRVHVHAPRERPARTLRDLLATGRAAVRRARTGGPRLAAVARTQPPVDAARRLLAGAHMLGVQPDVIHFEFGVEAAGSTWMGDVAACPVVVSFRGYDVSYAGLDEPGFYDDVWDHADAVHLLGEDLWQRALRRGCPPGKLHRLIPPAVDTARFTPGAPRGGERSPLVVLTVARLHWKKGHEYGLVAVRRLLDAGIDVEYRVLGAGPHEEAVRACVDDLGLAGHVRLLGDRPPDDVLGELRSADVLLHPAVSEGFGNAVLEAQAVEVPVVCTDAEGLGENVVDGTTGLVVPRRDSSALAAALARLAGDPDLRRRMGSAGRRHVKEQFAPGAQIEAFVDLYEEAVRAGRGIMAAPPALAARAPGG
jgi:glycosyltransferase involved in cell wall biosynthesis